jgi:hypothetical protein
MMTKPVPPLTEDETRHLGRRVLEYVVVAGPGRELPDAPPAGKRMTKTSALRWERLRDIGEEMRELAYRLNRRPFAIPDDLLTELAITDARLGARDLTDAIARWLREVNRQYAAMDRPARDRTDLHPQVARIVRPNQPQE